MSENENGMVRVNTRVGKNINEWLDKQSMVTGVSKSTLIHLALESYISQKEAVEQFKDYNGLLENISEGFKELDKKIDRIASGRSM